MTDTYIDVKSLQCLAPTSQHWIFIFAFSLLLFIPWIIQLKQENKKLFSSLEKISNLRDMERKGRIQLQKEIREEVQNRTAENGYFFSIIGHVISPFPNRRGTPRQPSLVPAARGKIVFNKNLIQLEHFKEIEQFSHLWVVWVFHENTNIGSNNISAKVKPPRLHGVKVGCLSTRSPHRPNPIGLSVVRVIGVGPDFIEISAVDMVDGTPVLDVKPYIPYDVIKSNYNLPMAVNFTENPEEEGFNIVENELKVPSWIVDCDIPMRKVQFSMEADLMLKRLCDEKLLTHYTDVADVKDLIAQVLRQDIRSIHRGRKNTKNEEISLKANELSRNAFEEYICQLDNFIIKFKTYEDYVNITDICENTIHVKT